MSEFYIVLAGVLARIAIPLLVLLALAFLLSRLDARWKRESQFLGKSAPALSKDLQPQIQSCPLPHISASAAQKSEEPCFQHFRSEKGDFNPACVECDVFLTSVAPVPEVISTH